MHENHYKNSVLRCVLFFNASFDQKTLQKEVLLCSQFFSFWHGQRFFPERPDLAPLVECLQTSRWKKVMMTKIWERHNRGTSQPQFFSPGFMWGAVDDRSVGEQSRSLFFIRSAGPLGALRGPSRGALRGLCRGLFACRRPLSLSLFLSPKNFWKNKFWNGFPDSSSKHTDLSKVFS